MKEHETFHELTCYYMFLTENGIYWPDDAVVVATLRSPQQVELSLEVLCLIEVWFSHPLATCGLNCSNGGQR